MEAACLGVVERSEMKTGEIRIKMEPPMGVDPTSYPLRVDCSTTELGRLNLSKIIIQYILPLPAHRRPEAKRRAKAGARAA